MLLFHFTKLFGAEYSKFDYFIWKNDPLLTWRDNGVYDEAGPYLILQWKLQRLIVKITISGYTPHTERAIIS